MWSLQCDDCGARQFDRKFSFYLNHEFGMFCKKKNVCLNYIRNNLNVYDLCKSLEVKGYNLFYDISISEL